MGVDTVIREIIREEFAELIASAPIPDPELISVEEAAAICGGVSKSVINELIAAAPENGFPSIRLGVRTIKIDKRRLLKWVQNGGLAE